MSTVTADDVVAMVVDKGSGICEVGFAGYEAQRADFPSIDGRPGHSFIEKL